MNYFIVVQVGFLWYPNINIKLHFLFFFILNSPRSAKSSLDVKVSSSKSEAACYLNIHRCIYSKLICCLEVVLPVNPEVFFILLTQNPLTINLWRYKQTNALHRKSTDSCWFRFIEDTQDGHPPKTWRSINNMLNKTMVIRPYMLSLYV